MTSEERSDYIQTLRDRFLKGNLDDVLIPGDPPMDRLLDAIFDKRLPDDATKKATEQTKRGGKPS